MEALIRASNGRHGDPLNKLLGIPSRFCGKLFIVKDLSTRASWVILAIVVLAGLGARVGWGLRQSSDDAAIDRLPDQREYLLLGQHLANHDGLWFSDPRFEQTVLAYRTPGYPILIWLCDAQVQIVRIAQAVLDAASIVAIYLLARRWLHPIAALVAAGFVAVNPYMIFFSGLILSETLFTAMMLWGMVLLVESGGPWPVEKPKRWMWLGGGLLLALSVLVRPGAIGLPVVLGAGAALVGDRSPRGHWPMPVMATMILLTAIVLFPWAARNRLELNDWIWTSTNDGITRYDGFNPNATGASDQRFVQWMPWLSDMSETARSRYLANLADHWIADHPLAALQLAVVKIGRTWSPVPLSESYGTRALYWYAGLIFGGMMDALIVVGLLWGKLPRAVKRFLLLPALYFTVSAALSVGSLRYLLPAQGSMAILAAAAMELWLRRRTVVTVTTDGIYAGESGSAV
jgi:4-amino-4-deoxy-L-arabinose transferase-like glycosyltransferase